MEPLENNFFHLKKCHTNRLSNFGIIAEQILNKQVVSEVNNWSIFKKLKWDHQKIITFH